MYKPDESSPGQCVDPYSFEGCADGEKFVYHLNECQAASADDCESSEVWYEPVGEASYCAHPSTLCEGLLIYEDGAGCRERVEEECRAVIANKPGDNMAIWKDGSCQEWTSICENTDGEESGATMWDANTQLCRQIIPSDC